MDLKSDNRTITRSGAKDAPSVADRWNAVPPTSRISYGTKPVPGKAITGPFDYEKPAEQARFAVLKGHVQQIEVLYLGTKHQRALYKRIDDWSGQWLSP